MSSTVAVQKADKMDTLLATLPQYPQRAANALKPLLDNAKLPEYLHFLYMMYHYTKDSERKCIFAADQSDPMELKAYFVEMAHEERGHYLLALRDYEAFGLQMETETVPPVVTQFNNFWYELGKKDCNEFVGALYVFESVADLVGKEVLAMIQRLQLTKKQSRWLYVHLEADHDHGDAAYEMCTKYINRNPSALVEAASQAAECWSAVFVEAFSKR